MTLSFGQELKEFVGAFKTGYDMFDSADEKAYKKQKRANDLRSDDDAHNWGEGDRKYRNDRAAVGDKQWGAEFDYRKERAGASDEQWAVGMAGQQEDRQLRRDDYKLRKAQGAGANGDSTRFDDYEAPGGAIPDEAPASPADGAAGARMSQAQSANEDSPVQMASYRPSRREASAIPASYGGDAAYNGGTGGGTKLSGPEVAMKMVTDLNRDFGMPKEIAYGVVGQLAGETGGFKSLQEISPTVKGSRGGYGYAQWTGPRRRQFEKFASEQGLDPASYEANYGFLRHELSNTSEGKVMGRLRQARSTDEAGRVFTDGFLRPGIPNYEGRQRWTNRVAGLFGEGKRAIRAAVGGMVEEQPALSYDDDDPLNDRQPEPETEVAENTAIPTPTPRPDYAGADTEQTEEPTRDAYEAGRRAVRDGLKRAIKDTGVDQDSAIDDPQLEKMRQNYLKGYGSAPSQMMRQAMDKIDPDRKLPVAERNMRAIGTVYQFYMQDGQPEKAQAAAGSMVQYYRSAANNFLALSQAAAEKGDTDNAAKAAVSAYANIPNGRDMQITKNKEGNYEVTVTDLKTGKPVHKEVVDPKKFAEAAMGFNPGTFDDEILRASGAAAPSFDGVSSEDRETLSANASGALETEGAVPEGYKAKDIAGAVTAVAGLKDNKMDSGSATARITGMLADPDADNDVDRYKSTYSARHVPGSNEKMVEVTTSDGDTFVMPIGDFNRIDGARKARLKEAMTAAEKEKTSAAKGEANGENLSKGLAAMTELFSRKGMREAADGAQRNPAGGAPGSAPTPAAAIPDDQGVVGPALRGAVEDVRRPVEGAALAGGALGAAGGRARNEMLSPNGQPSTPEEEARQLVIEAKNLEAQPGNRSRQTQERLAEIKARLDELGVGAIPVR